MRVLAGAVARQHPDVLAAHLRMMRSQRGFDLDLVYIDDSEAEYREANRDHFHRAGCRVLEASPRPDGAAYGVDEGSHRWAVPTFHYLAREKQRLLDIALDEGYDAIWLVDTDLLCGVDTLASLAETGKDIVNGVFWTSWSPGAEPQPQVWVRHPYGFEGAGWDAGELLRALDERQLVKVRGGGACILIRRDALKRGAAYWPLLDGLPSDGMWQGEDRHFSIRAERLRLEMWADAWPDIWHCYRPSQRAHLEEVGDFLQAAKPTAEFGDEVSLVVENLNEAALVGHREFVRGRLGALGVLPEIERALLGLSVGDEALLRVKFPEWYAIEHYRGRTLSLRIRLLGARSPFGPFDAPAPCEPEYARAVAVSG